MTRRESLNFAVVVVVWLQMTGVSVSPGSDQLVVVHLQGGNDLVICLQSVAKSTAASNDRVGELVGTLCRLWLA